MLINKPTLRGLTERLKKKKLFDNAKLRFSCVLLEECDIGSVSIKDYIKFLDFRFYFLF